MHRSFLPDALNDDALILIKACPHLRLTYELRVATFMAQQTHRRVLVLMTVDYTISPALEVFAREYSMVIRRQTT